MAKILVVDDDALVRQITVMNLCDDGNTTLEAADGDDALFILEHEIVDLVVTDILMPERDGIEVIVEIRKRHPRLPILAMSGGGRMQWNDALGLARRLGADDAIAKPFTPSALLEVVHRLLAPGPQPTLV